MTRFLVFYLGLVVIIAGLVVTIGPGRILRGVAVAAFAAVAAGLVGAVMLAIAAARWIGL